jgi:osmotically-inducible protein OsmY
MSVIEDEIVGGLTSGSVEQVAQSRLETSAYAALRTVRCAFHQGTLVLRGCVPTYFHKQLAQEAIRTAPGVTEIVNHISVCRVVHPDDRRSEVVG